MNQQFASYATGTAFLIQLTKAQVRTLIGISAPEGSIQEVLNLPAYKSVGSLLYKGLIGPGERGYVLTRAGKLTIQLLNEAGLIPSQSKAKALPDKFVSSLHEEMRT